ncbi:MAG TPA: hypothetical protein VF406_03355 [Thermodesulfobacteriota bacterium]
MSPVHLHLVLNHLPAIGVLFAGALFVVALFMRSAPFQRVALWFLVLSALAAVPVYLTGESAEEAVEHLPGVAETLIERHEEAAGVTFTTMEVLGGVALLAALIFRKAREVPRVVAAGLVALVVATSGLFTWTGYLGGQIRHAEIRSDTALADAGGAGEDGSGGEDRDDD